MSIRGKILTPGMLVIAMAIAVAGISAAYAMLRTTSEVPAQLVAVEATYQLGIYDTDLIPLSLLDFREVVAGNPTHASLSPNPPKDTDGRREGSGRGWVRELQGRWPGVLG